MILNKLIKYFFIIFLVKISNLLSYELNISGNEKLSLQDIQTLTQIEINKTDDIYIPLNVNRVNKYTTDLKLKRNKIKTKTNTLDLCMNLKCSN